VSIKQTYTLQTLVQPTFIVHLPTLGSVIPSLHNRANIELA